MLIKIEFESDIPIYEQLKRQIIMGIAKGEFKPGEELPSVRQLSGDIGINLHTVNKTYNILKEEGYLTINRRKGAMVKDELPDAKEEYIHILKDELSYLIADAKNRGINMEDFSKICLDIYSEFEKEV
ncbi:GntR family transcriptional regulator [Wansuia hejianensis]|uniref:GntR family transcriptional regulator n=1 Tax=Wansuia hejianensis TaxID=2763667 RepID=A0A926IN67_9FIRM|nr:GntR family transcriptional regulator [Wansuia hejianensis]MBC8591331.1 GntR family transcriptional regulator [Wansuia hejianensis]